MLLAMGSRLPVNFRCTAIAGRHRLPMVKLFLVIVFLSGIPLGSLSAGDNTNSPAVAAKPAETGKSAAVDPEHGPRFARGLKTFKEHVRAVLTQECLMCHGGDTVESGFNLSTREAMLKGGVNGPAIKPGAGSESLLIKLVTHSAEPAMPLDASKLAPEVVTHLKQWIDDGAPYDRPLIDEASTDRTPWTEREIVDDAKTYWAFQPLQVIPPPIAAEDHWSRSGVDRFVWAKLKEQGLTPNGDADRQRLVRRLYFNLLGLPPTPAEVTAFLADDSPDAVEKLVDQLLDRPAFGEKWARHWLDVARFAESHGFEQDYNREFAFHFRDFVIQAFNEDLPYDDFVRWQLAGDEFEPLNPLALKATGFLGAGVFPTQITKNEVERTRYDALDDMAATTGTAFLGLTVGCARCHDHKFDPIPQADYYRLVSTFTTTVRSNVDVVVDREAWEMRLAEWNAAHQPLVQQLQRFDQTELPTRFVEWDKQPRDLASRPKWITPTVTSAQTKTSSQLTPQSDGSVLLSDATDGPETFTLVVQTRLPKIQTVRIEALRDESARYFGFGAGKDGDFVLSDVTLKAASLADSKQTRDVKWGEPRATAAEEKFPAKGASDGDKKTGWSVSRSQTGNHALVIELVEPIEFEGGCQLTCTLEFQHANGHPLVRPRISVSDQPLPGEQEPTLPLLGGTIIEVAAVAWGLPAEERTAEQTAALQGWFAGQLAERNELLAEIDRHLAARPESNLVTMMICSEGVKPIRHHTQGADFFEQTFFLKRGDCDQKEGVAQQRFLQVLTENPDDLSRWRESPPKDCKTSYRRRTLANWITDTEDGAGQLLARVIVNRLWQQYFGRGIVATPNDFGRQGPPPTHPELLDWLAAELIRHDWHLKPIHKLLATSSVYRQSSRWNDAWGAIDPENRWLWRWEPRRLTAEGIRDSILAVSGRLDRTFYGPGTLDPDHTRRSIYFMIKRSQLVPMMQLFDQPEPLVSVGRRPSTTIAPQALLFMNGQQVRVSAEAFANQLQPASVSESAVVQAGYLQALGRPPTPAEVDLGVEFLSAQAESYRSRGIDHPQQQAAIDFCQALLGLNEFVYLR